MKRIRKGRYMTAEDLIGLQLRAEAIRINVKQLRGEFTIHQMDPLDVLNRIADLIDGAVAPDTARHTQPAQEDLCPGVPIEPSAPNGMTTGDIIADA